MSAYDPKCLELANHFTGHDEGCQCKICDELAGQLQHTAELFAFVQDIS